MRLSTEGNNYAHQNCYLRWLISELSQRLRSRSPDFTLLQVIQLRLDPQMAACADYLFYLMTGLEALPPHQEDSGVLWRGVDRCSACLTATKWSCSEWMCWQTGSLAKSTLDGEYVAARLESLELVNPSGE
jgi:hypothetical protein